MARGADDWGMVQVYTGEGKGKTTAAIGLAVRAAGWGKRVKIIQFLKGRDTGELHSLAKLAPLVDVVQLGTGEFVLPGQERRGVEGATAWGLRLAEAVLADARYDLVILDELMVALSLGLVTLEDVMALMRGKPDSVELVMTGRGAPPEVLAEADLVTHMCEEKHPFHDGIEARRGADY